MALSQGIAGNSIEPIHHAAELNYALGHPRARVRIVRKTHRIASISARWSCRASARSWTNSADLSPCLRAFWFPSGGPGDFPP